MTYGLSSSLFYPFHNQRFDEGVGPIVKTWQPPHRRYSSPSQYCFDTSVSGVAKVWQKNQRERYSSHPKTYNPVVPANAESSPHAAVIGEFDLSRLGQTDVLALIKSKTSFSHSGEISLADTVASLLNKIGLIEDHNGKSIGTCTLIARNLILTARHAVGGCNIRNLIVTFGYTTFNGSFYESGHTSLDRVVEENARCDYAIIQLKEPLGSKLGFVSLNVKDSPITPPALLHYPLGKPLKVSVNAVVQSMYGATDRLVTFHDSDYFSSGGAYFDPSGSMIAMHLGTELQASTMNLFRYALPLEAIVKRNPDSLLRKFAEDECVQNRSYTVDSPIIFDEPLHNYLIDEEGRESEKILRGLLTQELQDDEEIETNKNKTITFSPSNLKYISTTYSQKYQSFINQCLGRAGFHQWTNLYSVTGEIESDHTIPHHVWASTKNPKMKEIAKGKGDRPGEKKMPAITIPWKVHRNLRTTGSGAEASAFHQTLTNLCNADKIDEALILCYREYKAQGLDLRAYKTAIQQSLDLHIKMGLITTDQKKEIVKEFF